MRLPGVLTQSTLDAMDDFFRRASQAQRTSRAKAPKDEMRGLRLSYDIRSKVEDNGISAREMIGEFTRIAQAYAETVQAQRPQGREWKRLQKPIAQLRRLKSEHERLEALRRLKSRDDSIVFFTPPKGTPVPVKILDWSERPLYDTLAMPARR